MFRILSALPAATLRTSLLCVMSLVLVAPANAEFDIPDAFATTDKASTNIKKAVSKNIAVFKDAEDKASESTSTEQPAAEVTSPAPATPVVYPAVPSCNCNSNYCDCSRINASRKKIASAHKGLFYNNDVNYLCDPCYFDRRWNDSFKRFNFFGTTVETGGQTRFRYHSENNFRGLGLTGNDDDFLLTRHRLYLNWEISQNIRFFTEFIDANSAQENFAPRGIEENHADLLNLFVDIKLWDDCHGKLSARLGRQELLYGSQRLVSPLDWANTRRTFEGYKFMWEGSRWDIDGFYVNPVVVDRRNFDDANDDVDFYGLYARNKTLNNANMDLYWLAVDNDLTGEQSDTLGVRYNRNLANNFLFDFEGGYQFGDNADASSREAGYFTVGIGKRFNHRLNPTLWLYYDYAEGGDAQGAGNGFDDLFPLAHKYLGFMDLFGRSNIEDINLLFTMQLAPKAKMLLWYHSFQLENAADTPYNVNGSAFAQGVTPGDDDLGQEIDLLFSFDITPRTNLLLGYSHFFAGDYYDTAGLPVNGTDADFFYTQLQINF